MPADNIETYHAVLAHYPSRYRALRLEPLGGGGGFSGAVIVRVETDFGNYCLRGWPADSLPRRRILGLHRLLGFIYQQGVTQVPVPVSSEKGSTVVTVANRFWQLEPWMPGNADFHHDPTDVRLSESMACLARWHLAAARFFPQPSEREWFYCTERAQSPAVFERLEMIREWSGGKCVALKQEITQGRKLRFVEIAERMVQLFEQAAPAVTLQLETAAAIRFSLQPCLRDVWHDHLLFTGEQVTGLIDASACRCENVAADLARLLGSLVGDELSRWDFALAEYAKQRTLSAEETGLMTVLDRSGVLLSGMTWLDRCFLKKEHFENHAAVGKRLEIILERLEVLAKAL